MSNETHSHQGLEHDDRYGSGHRLCFLKPIFWGIRKLTQQTQRPPCTGQDRKCGFETRSGLAILRGKMNAGGAHLNRTKSCIPGLFAM